MRLISATAVALMLCASAANAADESGAAPAAQGEAEKPKKICRMETGTGSVMPKRVCRTQEQVAAEQEAARRAREEMNRNRGI